MTLVMDTTAEAMQPATQQECAAPKRRTPRTLLGVKLDDQLFFERDINLLPNRQTMNQDAQ